MKLGLTVSNLVKSHLEPFELVKALKAKNRFSSFKELVRIRIETQNVLDELFTKNPEETAWAIRKGLNPGFKRGEIISFKDQHGRSVQGRILSLEPAGAHVQETAWPRLMSYVSGKAIQKITTS